MRRTLPLSVTLLASGIAGCTHTQSAAGTLGLATTAAPASVLHQDSRTLWSDQVTLTQQYVAAVFANDPRARVDLVQLTRSHESIGQILKPYYGETAGDGLTAMLNNQTIIATALIHAIKADSVERKDELEQRLHENSHAIARYLAGLNPHWSPTELESILDQYVDLSALDLISRKGDRAEGGAAALDASLTQAKKLADVLSDGIARQFPQGPLYYPRNSH